MKGFYLFFIVLFFLSCKQEGVKVNVNTIEDKQDVVLSAGERKLMDKKQEIADSISLAKILEEAIGIAKDSIYPFKKTYIASSSVDGHEVSVTLSCGDLFSNSKKYLLIKREAPGVTCLDLYRSHKGNLKQVLCRDHSSMAFINDTIFDVNGDNHKDFVVHWYPMSGCCARDIYSVALNLAHKDRFTQDYDFVNPVFSPSEKIIRGKAYGHYSPYYKYKWNGLAVDTLEFVYSDSESGKYYITKAQDTVIPPLIKSRIVNKIPVEYKPVNEYY